MSLGDLYDEAPGPRQVGKSTSLRALAESLTAEGRYTALHTTCEVFDDDYQFVESLGLVAIGPGGLEIANPIYNEIIPRALTAVAERFVPMRRAAYVGEDGRLDWPALLDGFTAFWKQNAEWMLRQQPRRPWRSVARARVREHAGRTITVLRFEEPPLRRAKSVSRDAGNRLDLPKRVSGRPRHWARGGQKAVREPSEKEARRAKSGKGALWKKGEAGKKR